MLFKFILGQYAIRGLILTALDYLHSLDQCSS